MCYNCMNLLGKFHTFTMPDIFPQPSGAAVHHEVPWISRGSSSDQTPQASADGRTFPDLMFSSQTDRDPYSNNSPEEGGILFPLKPFGYILPSILQIKRFNSQLLHFGRSFTFTSFDHYWNDHLAAP